MEEDVLCGGTTLTFPEEETTTSVDEIGVSLSSPRARVRTCA